jgi:Lrp/AsnC family transcriptional regulator, leucine-responsive regulatory protein
MDEKDELILFELLQDCRQPTSKIAKAVRLPQQTVSYRIKNLEKEGVIKKYTANINYPKIGLSRHSIYLDIHGVNASDVDKYLKEITSIEEVSCCYMLHDVSQWKLYVSVWTKTIERYDEIQTKILIKFKDKIKNYLSFQSVKSYTYFARRLNSRKKAKVDIKGSPENSEISSSDWKLINLLKTNSRIPIVELSKKMNLNENSIMRKITSLKKKGIIERFYPILNMKKMGYTEYTYISRVDPSCVKEIDNFIKFVEQDPRFIITIKAVGYVNLYYAFLVKNREEFKEINEKIESILGKAVLENHKIEVEDMIS